VYGYPVEQAARVGIVSLALGLRDAASVQRVSVVAFSAPTLGALEGAVVRARTAMD
jgi:hypothetical protein